MAVAAPRRLKTPPLVVLSLLIVLCGLKNVSGAAVVAATALQCRISSSGHSVLHGQPAASNVRYWDRTPTALKAGLIREISVYYDSKQECIAGIKLTYGTKPSAVSHLMGTERGPGFYEKLLMLWEKEYINRVDVGYSTKCIQYLQWYTSDSRSLRAGASPTSSSSKTGVTVPENSDWHLASLRGTFSDGVINQLQMVWGEVDCKKVVTDDSPRAPTAKAKLQKHTPIAATTQQQQQQQQPTASSSTGSTTNGKLRRKSTAAPTTRTPPSSSSSSGKHIKAPTAAPGVSHHTHPATAAHIQSVYSVDDDTSADSSRTAEDDSELSADEGTPDASADSTETDSQTDTEAGSIGGEHITVETMTVDWGSESDTDTEAAADSANAADTDDSVSAAAGEDSDLVQDEAGDAGDTAAEAAWLAAVDEKAKRADEEAAAAAGSDDSAAQQEQEQEHIAASKQPKASAKPKSTAPQRSSKSTAPAAERQQQQQQQQQKVQLQALQPVPAASKLPAAHTQASKQQQQQSTRSQAPAAAPKGSPVNLMDMVSSTLGLDADEADFAGLYTKDEVLPPEVQSSALQAQAVQANPPTQKQLQQQQQHLQQSIVSRLVSHHSAPQAPQPAILATAEDTVSVTPMDVPSVFADVVGSEPDDSTVQQQQALQPQQEQQAPAQETLAAQQQQLQQQQQMFEQQLQQQQPQQAQQMGTPGAAGSASQSSSTITTPTPTGVQPSQPDLTLQQRQQQLLQQHQQWQQEQLAKLQQQQQQPEAASLLLQQPAAPTEPLATVGQGSTPGGTTPVQKMRFRAMVPPSVTCDPAPHLCDLQQDIGHPAACPAVAPLTTPECVGGCCMSSGRCSSGSSNSFFAAGSSSSTTASCVAAGLGQPVTNMQCTGLNNNQAAKVLDGSLCQNLGCRLAMQGCTSGPMGLGGHCVGRVVALGPLSKSHPEGVKYLGYPCLDATASTKTLNLFGELTDTGFYVAQTWNVCNCNGAPMPQVPGEAATQNTAAETAQSMSGASAAADTGGIMQLLSLLTQAGNSSAQAAAGTSLLQQLAAQAAGGGSSGSNRADPQTLARAAAGLMSMLARNASQGTGQQALMASPMGLDAAVGQLSGSQGPVMASIQQMPAVLSVDEAPVQGLSQLSSNGGSNAAAGSAGSSGGLNWGELLKEATAKAATAMKAAERGPANNTAGTLGGWMSALLSAAGAGNTEGSTANKAVPSAATQARGGQQQQQVSMQGYPQGAMQGQYPAQQISSRPEAAQQQQQQPAAGPGTVFAKLLSKVWSATQKKDDGPALEPAVPLVDSDQAGLESFSEDTTLDGWQDAQPTAAGAAGWGGEGDIYGDSSGNTQGYDQGEITQGVSSGGARQGASSGGARQGASSGGARRRSNGSGSNAGSSRWQGQRVATRSQPEATPFLNAAVEDSNAASTYGYSDDYDETYAGAQAGAGGAGGYASARGSSSSGGGRAVTSPFASTGSFDGDSSTAGVSVATAGSGGVANHGQKQHVQLGADVNPAAARLADPRGSHGSSVGVTSYLENGNNQGQQPQGWQQRTGSSSSSSSSGEAMAAAVPAVPLVGAANPRPRRSRGPAGGVVSGLSDQSSMPQNPAAASGYPETAFITNRPQLYAGHNKMGPAARAARARGGGYQSAAAAGMPVSNLRQGQPDNSDSGSVPELQQQHVQAAAVSTAAPAAVHGQQQQQQQQQSPTAQQPSMPSSVTQEPAGLQAQQQQQQQRHAHRRAVAKPAEMQPAQQQAPQQQQQGQMPQEQHPSTAAQLDRQAAAVGAAVPAELPSQLQQQQPHAVQPLVQRQQTAQPATLPQAHEHPEQQPAAKALDPHQQQQPQQGQESPGQQQQQQQQPEVEVQVQALPTPTPTSPSGVIPLAASTAASILPNAHGADNAMSEDSTFVMPGGPSVPANGSKQQQQQQQPAAAAGKEHRGAGVVIDDEAWRQQTAGQGVAAGEQQGQRQVWRPSLNH